MLQQNDLSGLSVQAYSDKTFALEDKQCVHGIVLWVSPHLLSYVKGNLLSSIRV